ncbi:MAG TPA: ATP-binding protein [Dissulfurispiraceae bacterium]|nr:ATP-binding protein [Dissulfurispiraceae bacterium]
MLEEALRRTYDIIEFFPDATIVIDADRRVVAWNHAIEVMTGIPKSMILGKEHTACAVPFYGEARFFLIDLVWHPDRQLEAKYDYIKRKGNLIHAEVFAPTLYGGRGAHISITASALLDREGNIVGAIESIRDITELKSAEKDREMLEMQLRHAQKMEAVGQLAGGIAHDFNNLLTTIIGYGNLLQMKLDRDDPLRIYAEQILSSAEKAANLTQGLLAFSRRQVLNPRVTEINEIVRGVESLLVRLIREDIRLSVHITHENLPVVADGVQIEQVLMNLATNSRDAMPNGGEITITTEGVNIEETFMRTHGFGKFGRYALITFEDTGIGMSKKTREKIFEPFFTTKEVGKGTGLGLAMVYGIIKQHEGYIEVASKMGRGTTFRIYLPLTSKKAPRDGTKQFRLIPRGSQETILLVEDNQEVRNLTRMVLEEFGYHVIEAEDGEEAICRFLEYRESIDLLILDVVMPKKSGKEVYDEIKKLHPRVRFIFTSGHAEDFINKTGVMKRGFPFMKKPTKPHELLRMVREVLDS